MATATFTAPGIEFEVTRGAVKLARGHYRDTDAPFHFANKARAYSKLVKTGARPYGGKHWKELKACEAAVTLAAKRARSIWEAASGREWNRAGRFVVKVRLEFGDRSVPVRRKGSAPSSRRMKGAVRCRRTGLDKGVQAILDALQGVIFEDDEQTVALVVQKAPRLPVGTLGDRALVAVYRFPDRPEA